MANREGLGFIMNEPCVLSAGSGNVFEPDELLLLSRGKGDLPVAKNPSPGNREERLHPS